jgi:hypothetical protein
VDRWRKLQSVMFQEPMTGCSKYKDIAVRSESRSAQIVLPVEYEVSVQQGDLEGCEDLVCCNGRSHAWNRRQTLYVGGRAASVDLAGNAEKNHAGERR